MFLKCFERVENDKTYFQSQMQILKNIINIYLFTSIHLSAKQAHTQKEMLTACWWVPPGEGIPPSSAWSGRPCPPSRPAIQILYLECLQNLNTKSPERTQITDKADLHLRKPVLALSHLATKRALVCLRLLQRLLESFDLLVLPVDLLVQRVDLLLQSSSDVLWASSNKAEHSLLRTCWKYHLKLWYLVEEIVLCCNETIIDTKLLWNTEALSLLHSPTIGSTL